MCSRERKHEEAINWFKTLAAMEKSRKEALQGILISDSRSISAVQSEFHQVFPFLKIEFLFSIAGPHQVPGQAINPARTIGECRSIHTKSSMLISEGMSRAEIEQELRASYGISVQLFRMSGKEWLLVTFTDNWSIGRQNEEGRFLSLPH